MTQDELKEALTNIGTVTDDAERRNLITQVTGEVNSLFESNSKLTEQSTKMDADMKRLQEYNMQLYLQVQGQHKPNDQGKAGSEKPALKYENLFDEKGEIK